MCGRFGLTRPDRLDLQRFGVTGDMSEQVPRFNIPPSSDILVVRERKGVPEAEMEPFLLIECPRYLFPFAREIVSRALADN